MSEIRFPDLRGFIEQLRRDGDLATVEVPVDARLEVAEIHRRVIAAGGPALLFTNVEQADFPLVTNLFGTARRAEMAFGRRPGRLIRRVPHDTGDGLIASGVVKGGMIPKLEACLAAGAAGISAQIVNGTQPGALIGCLEGTVTGTAVA